MPLVVQRGRNSTVIPAQTGLTARSSQSEEGYALYHANVPHSFGRIASFPFSHHEDTYRFYHSRAYSKLVWNNFLPRKTRKARKREDFVSFVFFVEEK